MSNPGSPESQPINEPNESFQDILSQFEQSKSRKPAEAGQGREGTDFRESKSIVVAISR